MIDVSVSIKRSPQTSRSGKVTNSRFRSYILYISKHRRPRILYVTLVLFFVSTSSLDLPRSSPMSDRENKKAKPPFVVFRSEVIGSRNEKKFRVLRLAIPLADLSSFRHNEIAKRHSDLVGHLEQELMQTYSGTPLHRPPLRFRRGRQRTVTEESLAKLKRGLEAVQFNPNTDRAAARRPSGNHGDDAVN